VPIWSKSSLTLRDKIQYLTVLRVLTTTLLLGSAIGLNINNVKHFDHPSYLGLSSIIIATYGFTVLYGWWLKRTRSLVLAAHLGLAFDALAASAQVGMTGMMESPFSFLFVLVALYGGLVMGRAGGLTGALYSTLGLGLVAVAQAGWVKLPWLALWQPEWSLGSSGYRMASLAAASMVAGLLCGFLAERLENTQLDLAKSKQSIAALENLNHRILESLGSGLLTADLNGHIVYANEAAGRLLGLSPQSLVGQPLASLGLTSTTSRWEQEWSRPSDGATQTLGLSRTALKGLQEEAVGEVVTFQDLTNLRRAEEALRQRERLATLGRFAAKIAHEIRNPLASISGAAELLSEGVNEEDKALTGIVQREVDRLNGLLKQVLEFSKPQPLLRRPISLAALAQEVAALFQLQLGADIAFSLSVEDASVRCLGDPQALHQVLWNLWRNAAEAARAHDQPSDAPAAVKTRIWRDGASACFQICDTGPGIDPEQRLHLFEPFWTTKRGGTGLGLTTIHQIISDHGGEVTLAPWVAGQGACFTVSLPASVATRGDDVGSDDIGGDDTDATHDGEGSPRARTHDPSPHPHHMGWSARSAATSLGAHPDHHAEAP
jgi:two-component system sensor histidine kinase PilS (NtrC family)